VNSLKQGQQPQNFHSWTELRQVDRTINEFSSKLEELDQSLTALSKEVFFLSFLSFSFFPFLEKVKNKTKIKINQRQLNKIWIKIWGFNF